jgi:hypothetical protein
MLGEQQKYVRQQCLRSHPCGQRLRQPDYESRMLAEKIAVPGECLGVCVLTQNPCGSPDKVIFLFILPVTSLR